MIRKSSLDFPAIRKFALNEMRPRIKSASMAFTQIIENGNFVSLIEQQLGANAPNVARTANDKDFHWREKCRVIAVKSKPTREISVARRERLQLRAASLKPEAAGEYSARRFCPSFSQGLRPSSARNYVCNAGRGL
jgi:hypothetical protein